MRIQQLPTPQLGGPANGGSVSMAPVLGKGPTGATGPTGPTGPTGAPGGSDGSFAGWINDTASATRAALNSSIDGRAIPRWQPLTAYVTGDIRMAPDGSLVERTSDGTSGSTYSGTNWKPATGLANIVADRVRKDRRRTAEILRNKMAVGTSCTWVHVGDSTGDATDEWVRLSLAAFAKDYPNQKVTVETWNDTTQAYDAPVTVQAGAGSFPTLRVLNGSMPGGSFVSYFDSRPAIMVPIEPDLLTISSSHNDAGGSLTDYFLRLDAFIKNVTDRFPAAAVALSSQNPEFTPRDSTTIAGHLLRNRSLRGHALDNGWGYIAAFERFWQRSDFGAGVVSATDGVHPTTEGSQLWRDAALDFLRGTEHDTVRSRDTGWRLVATGTIGVLNGFKCAARRIGNTVHVVTDQTGAGATGTGAVTVATLPVGMRATSPVNMYPLVSGSVIGSDTLPIAGASIFTDETGAIVVNAVSGKRHYCNLTYTTTEGWPAGLPGTPA